MESLTIVTSCAGYGTYLNEWARSIVRQAVKPGTVIIFTHGSDADEAYGARAHDLLTECGIASRTVHHIALLDFGRARNEAVSLSDSEWVMHLDADDLLMPHAIADIRALADESADIIALGYERSGDLGAGPKEKRRIYQDLTGSEILRSSVSPCSGVSPFRRSLWERAPYREDMRGGWDTALWLGFGKMGARLKATSRTCFWYRQHADSIYNQRRTQQNWNLALTHAQLQGLRGDGVALIVPRDAELTPERERVWYFLKQRYRQAFPSLQVVEGFAPGGSRWSKSAAIRDALTRIDAALLIVADADCWVNPLELYAAVQMVALGKAGWVVPHRLVKRLDQATTNAAIAGTTVTPVLERQPYEGFAGGGMFVVLRRAYEATGGIPERFTGWGGEDEALAVVLDCLLGQHARLPGDLVHYWHPPQVTKTRSDRNRNLVQGLKTAAAYGADTLREFLATL